MKEKEKREKLNETEKCENFSLKYCLLNQAHKTM